MFVNVCLCFKIKPTVLLFFIKASTYFIYFFQPQNLCIFKSLHSHIVHKLNNIGKIIHPCGTPRIREKINRNCIERFSENQHTRTIILSLAWAATMKSEWAVWALKATTSWKCLWSGLGLPFFLMLLLVVSAKCRRPTVTFAPSRRISTLKKHLQRVNFNADVYKGLASNKCQHNIKYKYFITLLKVI